jgi:uncharacterized protein (DUF1330 family)
MLMIAGGQMAKGYWITFYRSVTNPNALAQYAKLAEVSIRAKGGRFLARGMAARVEGGPNQRSVIIEFDSLADAVAAYESPDYQAAVKFLTGAVERGVRIVEGID